MTRRGILLCSLGWLSAAPAAAQSGGRTALQPGQLQRGYQIDERGNITWWWRLDRPGQSPLLGNDPPPMTPAERQAIMAEAERIRAAYARRHGRGTGGPGTQGSNQLPHRYGGPNTTRRTWNQNPNDPRAMTPEDARRRAAEAEAARRAEFMRRGIPYQ